VRLTKTVTVGQRAVEVRELTVADIRAWLKSLEAEPAMDVLDATLFEEFSLADLARMTDLSAAEMEAMAPSELRQVQAACAEVNADFFGMRARLAKLGQAALAAQGAS
jgi:hypothetical protein